MDVESFVRSRLPPAPANVLEVGCGEGALARALASAGYSVTAIDPEAPTGPMFRRVSLEDLEIVEPFAAVVANRSLHHIHDLHGAVHKMQAAVCAGGILVLNEFGHDRMDTPTARWYLQHEGSDTPPDRFLAEWTAERAGLHSSSAIRAAVRRSFRDLLFEWVPYIGMYHLEGERLAREEARLIAAGAIAGLGYRYVGQARDPRAEPWNHEPDA